jgi:hypothetical protein
MFLNRETEQSGLSVFALIVRQMAERTVLISDMPPHRMQRGDRDAVVFRADGH